MNSQLPRTELLPRFFSFLSCFSNNSLLQAAVVPFLFGATPLGPARLPILTARSKNRYLFYLPNLPAIYLIHTPTSTEYAMRGR